MLGKPKISGQYLAELAICLAVTSTAFLALQIYLQGVFQARYAAGPACLFAQIEKEAAKQGKAHLQNLATQYEPDYLQSNITQTNSGTSTDQTITRSGWEKVTAPGELMEIRD